MEIYSLKIKLKKYFKETKISYPNIIVSLGIFQWKFISIIVDCTDIEYCLKFEKKINKWLIYMSEKSVKIDICSFENEVDACNYFYDWIRKTCCSA